jgi:hypothetical protein
MASLSPAPKFYEHDASGAPLVGGLVYTYLAGTTTPTPTYTDSSGDTENTNPVELDASGRANIWLASNVVYKFIVADADDDLIYTVDNISAPLSASSFDDLWLVPGVMFNIVADGTDMTTELAAALASGENISLPRGIIGYDGDAALTLAYARMGQKLFGAGTTDVANAPTRGTVLKRLSGTGPGLTIATYTEGTVINGICFDQNGFAGNAIKTGMHKGIISDVVIHDQLTDYGILVTGCNLSRFAGIRFTGTCQGGIQIDNTAAIGYGALYTVFDQITMVHASGDLTDYGVKIADSSCLTFNDFFVQGGKGVYINDGIEDVTFNQLRGEMDDAQELMVVDASTGDPIIGVNVNGGRVTQVDTNAAAVAFFRLNAVQGFHLNNYKITDAISAANRPYFLLTGVLGSSIKNVVASNTSGNAHYFALSATTRSDQIKLENIYNSGAGTSTLSVQLGSSKVELSNMALAFNAASQLMHVEGVSNVNVDNANSGILVLGASTFTDTSGVAGRLGFSGNLTFTATQSASANPNTLDDYQEASYTATATGGTTAPTGTVNYTKVGNTAEIYVPAFSFTSDAATYTLTGAPADIRPGGQRAFLGNSSDNGAGHIACTVRMETSGTLTLFRNVATDGFTGSGTKGNLPFDATYLLF